MAQRSDPLSSGMTFSGGSRDPISAQFSNIRSLIGPQTSTPGIGTPATTTPTTSPTGTPGFTAGPNSSDIFRQGLNLAGTAGTSLFGQGSDILSQPLQFFQALLSGDPTAMQNALAPTAATIRQQFVAPTQQAQNFMPRGGYSAGTQAELPFAEAGQIGNAALGLQPAAAQELAGLGTQQQQMGLQQIQQLIQGALGKMGVTTGITGNLANVGSFLSSII